MKKQKVMTAEASYYLMTTKGIPLEYQLMILDNMNANQEEYHYLLDVISFMKVCIGNNLSPKKIKNLMTLECGLTDDMFYNCWNYIELK